MSKISWHFPFKRQEASRDQIMHIYTVLDYLLPENIYLSREKNSENTTDKFPVLNTRQITELTCTFLIPKLSLTFNTV